MNVFTVYWTNVDEWLRMLVINVVKEICLLINLKFLTGFDKNAIKKNPFPFT